jgi:glycine hydroxymethyltransferase
MPTDAVRTLLDTGIDRLRRDDPELYRAMTAESARQADTLSLVASSSVVDPSVLAALTSVAVNVTAEGYPGRRYHAGCQVVDDLERLAVSRAQQAFGARYVNVQPHSATTANYTVLSSLLRPGDTLLGMALESGGHLTHGSPAAYAGRYFHAVGYGLDADGRIDYDQVAALAAEHRPRVIICGATAYPRTVDFARFREIADSVGAYLLADISHTAGLVVAGLHPSPVPHAHITTTCTHKQLYGPRGGLIMCGPDGDAPAPTGKGTLADFLQRAVFPFSQGAPALNAIAGKARALGLCLQPEFRSVARRIVECSTALAGRLAERGHEIVSGGTDNHIVLVDLAPRRMTGLVAELALQDCGIVVNKNRVPGDTTPALVTGGIRIGTNSMAARGMGAAQAIECADLIHQVLDAVRPEGRREYTLPADVAAAVRARAAVLCEDFPLPYDTGAGLAMEPAA